jgi:cyclopropane-fatty-acyl-phospholipid synthase
MSSNAAAKRLSGLRRLLTHAHESMSLQIGFVLWDGSTVPADLRPDAIAISIADEGVVASLIRRRNLDTLANLWVAGRIDIRNGTIFDLVARRPKVRSRDILRGKTLNRGLALATALRFLFVPRGGPWPLENIPVDRPTRGDLVESKRNVEFSYDQSNSFYAVFADPEMAATCGYFHDWSDDYATAQRNKLDIICRKLRLKPGERMLDIGCGWGGLICHAAQNYGVMAHGVTLSQEQYAWARDKIAKLALTDRVMVELNDYTMVRGEYDKISQVEMIDHVGLANRPTFYRTVYRLLKPDGLYFHQENTTLAKLNDKISRRRRAAVAAYSRYMLPGTEYGHIGMALTNLERFGFEVHDVEGLREHYALTFRLAHNRLYANREAAEREVGTVMVRKYLAWLAAVSIALDRNRCCCYAVLASKRRRGRSGLPPTRADLYRAASAPRPG